jgi:hypothetical protein
MGDTECTQQILEGTCDFPLDTDIWTKKILQEAHYTFSHMSGAEFTIIVTTEDFQNFWRRVDERTSFSFSGVTFSHYKAAASNPMLSAMHAAYLTAFHCKGLPIGRWGIGLNVLLEDFSLEIILFTNYGQYASLKQTLIGSTKSSLQSECLVWPSGTI